MKVAILGIEQPSLIVADMINKFYNPWLEQRLGEPLDIVAFVAGGTNIPPNIGNVAVLNLVQFAALYHKKLIDKIIFPREIFFETQKATLSDLLRIDVNVNDICISARLKENMNAQDFLEPYPTVRYLPHIEFRIAEHCNLNCEMCT